MSMIMVMILCKALESQGGHLRGLLRSKKLLRKFNPKSCNEGFLLFLECQRLGQPKNCGNVV